MSTPLHELLKADPHLEGDVADDKADPSVCIQLHQISLLQYFLETAGSMDHKRVLQQGFFLSSCHRGCTALANREGWRVAGELVPQDAQIIHDVGSLCISTMRWFNFFLVKITLKQELQVKETHSKGDRWEFNHYALLHHQAVLHNTLPPLPRHLLLIIIILILLLIFLLLLLFKEVWKASRPSLL